VFNRTWTRQARQARKRGTGFVLCEVFDIAMRAALLAIGKPWPEESAAHNVTPIMGKRAA